MNNHTEEIASPCIGVCTLDESTGLCLGCFRNAEEIKTWWDMDKSSKIAVLNAISERESATL